eukprot:GHVP01059731.1.p1 GENE.GHVP01059731.1~~GHVP01059731.1.p1  ORF type:complete len:296 (+),score=64.64 GHVP01059731.1:384-1271(+)
MLFHLLQKTQDDFVGLMTAPNDENSQFCMITSSESSEEGIASAQDAAQSDLGIENVKYQKVTEIEEENTLERITTSKIFQLRAKELEFLDEFKYSDSLYNYLVMFDTDRKGYFVSRSPKNNPKEIEGCVKKSMDVDKEEMPCRLSALAFCLKLLDWDLLPAGEWQWSFEYCPKDSKPLSDCEELSRNTDKQWIISELSIPLFADKVAYDLQPFSKGRLYGWFISLVASKDKNLRYWYGKVTVNLDTTSLDLALHRQNPKNSLNKKLKNLLGRELSAAKRDTNPTSKKTLKSLKRK